jgi:hypothetical protein
MVAAYFMVLSPHSAAETEASSENWGATTIYLMRTNAVFRQNKMSTFTLRLDL